MTAEEIALQTGDPRRANYFLNLNNNNGVTLIPGAVYSLRVVTSTGELATGTTTVPGVGPGSFDSTNVPTFFSTRDTLRLDWSRVPGAKSYYVAISGRQNLGAKGVLDIERYFTFADTSLTLPGTMKWFWFDEDRVFIPSDTITVVVAAVDDNYYTYYHVFVDPFAGAPPTRLTGAIGVFGSLVPLIRQRYYVEF